MPGRVKIKRASFAQDLILAWSVVAQMMGSQ